MKVIVALVAVVLVMDNADALICVHTTCQNKIMRTGNFCGMPRQPRRRCTRMFYVTYPCDKVCDAGLSEWKQIPSDGGTKDLVERRSCSGELRHLREGEVCASQDYHRLERPAGEHWSYSDVDAWKNEFSGCGGNSQSPVDITDAEGDASLGQFTLENFDNVDNISWTLVNNGHTVQVTYTSGDLRMSGGGLPGEFRVAQFHFHWGSNASTGSEHTYNGHFPLEMHVVSYNVKYGSVDSSLQKPDGLAVLAVFFQETKKINAAFDPLVSKLKLVRRPDTNTTLDPIPLGELIPELTGYYRYKGSLTTPPCSEVVTWTLLPKSPLTMSTRQMNKFRALRAGGRKRLVNNFRPTQPLNGRVIKSSK